MDELNPDHLVTRSLRGQWHKLLALVMFKLEVTEVHITGADLERLARVPGGTNILAHDRADGLHIRLVSDAEAAQLAAANTEVKE